MNIIDAGDSGMVRAPSSSGKTVLSLYLAQKMKDKNKITLYVAPNKPLCNEFSLFVYKQGLKFSVGTEDYFSWEDMINADVIICTPPIFVKVLLFEKHNEDNNNKKDNIMSKVAALILDELPNTLHNHPEGVPFILFLASSLGWQTLILSATLSDDLMTVLYSIFPSIRFLDPKEAIRPTDLLIHRIDQSKEVKLQTSSLYTTSLLESEDRLALALRVPITLKEFKEIFPSLPKSSPSYSMLMNKLASPNGLKGSAITELTIECCRENKHQIERNENYNRNIFIESQPTSEELFQLLKSLKKLPVMLFHSNKDQLDKYHKEISEMLLKEKERYEAKVSKYIPKKSLDNNSSEDESPDYHQYCYRFGRLEDEELAEIFKHKVDRSGAEGTRKFKLGFRGNKVKKSEYYQGIKLGLGIHHRDIDSAVRDAVEAGLRMGYLKVVLCDYTMALGLNMPIKSVIFVGGMNETISPEQFVQASGRAGRWGLDNEGSVIFMGYSWKQVKRIWDPISPISKLPFPISDPLLLSLCASAPNVRKVIQSWFKFSIPQWNWTPATCISQLAAKLIFLQDLGLVSSNFEVTRAGIIALSLIDEGDISLQVGYTFYRFEEDLRKSIETPKDFLFICSHFLKRWRTSVKNSPTLKDTGKFSNKVQQMMEKIQTEVSNKFKIEAFPTAQITSLYTSFPDISAFHGHHKFSLYSLTAHFVKKMELFQSKARLPYGDEALNHLKNNIEKAHIRANRPCVALKMSPFGAECNSRPYLALSSSNVCTLKYQLISLHNCFACFFKKNINFSNFTIS
jgi:hypothetical protein